MIWAVLLLVVNAIGLTLSLATVAGWSVNGLLYVMWITCLKYLSYGTLILLLIRFLIRFAIAGKADGPGLRGLGTRIRESIVQTVAWFTVGTFYLMGGGFPVGTFPFSPMGGGLRGGIVRQADIFFWLEFGAIVMICSSLLFIRQFRRYTRWRSLCFRRESGGYHPKAT